MITRRGFFGLIAAAFVAKPVVVEYATNLTGTPKGAAVLAAWEKYVGAEIYRPHPAQLYFLSQEGPMVLWGGGHGRFLGHDTVTETFWRNRKK